MNARAWRFHGAKLFSSSFKATVLIDVRTALFVVVAEAAAEVTVTLIAAEFVGTFMLMFAGTAAAITNKKTNGLKSLLGCAVVTGLWVTVIILCTGHISGAHLNPAVTIAFAALKHFPWKKVPIVCAAFALKGVYHRFMGGGVTVSSGEYGQAFALQFIIIFNLMFVVTAFATDTILIILMKLFMVINVGQFARMAVGATVTFNILIAGTENERHDLSIIHSFTLWIFSPYDLAQILGALGGAGTYCVIKFPNDDENSEL
ncbi:hypothetical protein AAHE18_13G092400 [Arachis hypogaea]